ncbi:uncharacterized protein LOC121683888 isoform X2 [Alosa sapidissima]|uniref:uncharacterized protein LOC121683888 isoform X2 n=1 Tax=Alosa sapidissima TaxID=34773 RepID=UPI001C08AF2E|nr:uncharacterized protein LOC121683888 isoform X2 [Alosa sapidissima]
MSKTQPSQKKKVAVLPGGKTPARKNLAAIKVHGLLRAYESHCMKMGSCVSTVLREDFSRCIDIQKPLTKCLLLEHKGRTVYPLTTLELLDCRLDHWALTRLGRAVALSSITTLSLDYTPIELEGLKGLLSGLEWSSHVLSLSLCYCGLGPWSGSPLASLVSRSAVRHLYINGNGLQRGGATELLQPLAEHSEQTAMTQQTTHPTDTANENSHQGLSQDSREKRVKGKGQKKRRQRVKRKSAGAVATGPWLEKLHMLDNAIDEAGPGATAAGVDLINIICVLVKHSSHLLELDLGENHVGEAGGKLLLEALIERRKAKHPPVKIRVSTRMSPSTFSAILKSSKELKSVKRKRPSRRKTKKN